MRIGHFTFLLTLLFCLSSCSWIKKRRSFFWEDPKKNILAEDENKVTKSQYNQLMKKYDDLLKKYREGQWFGKKPGDLSKKSKQIH